MNKQKKYGIKEREYSDYIKTHVNNVKKAFFNYGDIMLRVLDYESPDVYLELNNRIDIHDDSKWSLEEYEPYRKKFYPYQDEVKISDYEFNKAWLHHIHNNPHHPEYWIYYNADNKTVTIYDMDDFSIIEMLCDWIAMGMTHNNTAYDYYRNNPKKKEVLSPNTQFKVNKILNEIELIDNTIKEFKEEGKYDLISYMTYTEIYDRFVKK